VWVIFHSYLTPEYRQYPRVVFVLAGSSRDDVGCYSLVYFQCTHGARARYHYFQCLQLLLRKQIGALTSLWNYPLSVEVSAIYSYNFYFMCSSHRDQSNMQRLWRYIEPSTEPTSSRAIISIFKNREVKHNLPVRHRHCNDRYNSPRW